jgi:prepilin-type N-terminal cleavage/methylation domain-containing protein
MDNKQDKGFTLVELLIVIVILGILATVTVFAVRGITDQGTGLGLRSRPEDAGDGNRDLLRPVRHTAGSPDTADLLSAEQHGANSDPQVGRSPVDCSRVATTSTPTAPLPEHPPV